jgi:Ni/Co efflux regulator RcnB
MRKLIVLGLLAAVTAPTAVSAQSRAEIREDRRDLREERQELRDARRFGDRRDVREERRDVREARRELREDRADRRAYLAPHRGWTYRTLTPGYQLQPSFYGSRYVIANPNAYRLPYAGRNRQWIRYGNDLVLVNVRNGRVLQVLRNRYY